MTETQPPKVQGAWIFPLELPADLVGLTTQHIATLLKISPATWRGWVSRSHAPKKDGDVDNRTPYWYLSTIIEYTRNAPGGRLGYPIG